MGQSLRLALSLLLVLSLGCQKRRYNNDEQTLVNAYKLIDAQRADEAIAILEAETAKMDPEGKYYVPYRMALASAYAHKAGFRVQRFGKLLTIGKIDVKFTDHIKVDRDKKVMRPEAVDSFLKSIGKFMVGISKLTGVYAAVPNLEKDGEKYLLHSLKILDSLKPEKMSPGDALYRAVVRVVYLKHYLATRVFDDGVPIEANVQTCQINFDKITGTLHQITKYCGSILSDLAKAQPKNADKFRKSGEKVAQVATDLTVTSTFASLVDDATLAMSKEALVETGMRKLLKCNAAAQVSESQPQSPSAAR